MASYRYVFQDFVTGTRIAELPVSNVKYSSRLNSAGVATGSVKLPSLASEDDRIMARIINDAVDENRREWVIERDGVVMWAGPIWASPYQDDKQTRELAAADQWSYFGHRVIDQTARFASIDQLQIARTLINTAQAATGGDIGVTAGTELSGVLRDRVYNGFEQKNLREAIEQLAAVDRGFEFGIDPYWDPTTGALVKPLRFSYPRRGRPQSQTGHVFELGRNVVSWNWPSDGTRTANQVLASGRGEGDAMLVSTASDNWQIQPITSGGPGYPLLQTTISNGDVSEQSTLDEQATARLKGVSRPVVIPPLRVRADIDPVLGSYITGDSFRFVIPPGMTPRFPDGLDTFLRILEITVAVGDDGSEVVDITAGVEPSA